MGENEYTEQIVQDVTRGEILLAEYYFDNSFRIRPVLVVQNDIGNKYSPLVIVVPIISNIGDEHNLPMNVLVDNTTTIQTGIKDSSVLLNVILTIDKKHIKDKLGRASTELLAEVEKGLLLSLGIQIY